jgi:hypothetical protein
MTQSVSPDAQFPQASEPATLYPLQDGIASVSLVQHVGDDKMTTSSVRCIYHLAIQQALINGYRCDTEHGVVFGLKGFALKAQKRGKQRYGTITLSVPDMEKRQYAVPVHKVIAFAIWREAAFARGIHVRHLDNNSENNRAENLALGSASDNERDKSAVVKSRAARIARAAQASPHNVRFVYHEVDTIRQHCDANRVVSGRIRRGIVKDLALYYNVTPAAISSIANRKNYGN